MTFTNSTNIQILKKKHHPPEIDKKTLYKMETSLIKNQELLFFTKNDRLSKWLCSIGDSYEKYKSLFDKKKFLILNQINSEEPSKTILKKYIKNENQLNNINNVIASINYLLSRNPLTWDENDTSEFLCTLGRQYWNSIKCLKENKFTVSKIFFLSIDNYYLYEKCIQEKPQRNEIILAIEWLCNPLNWTPKQVGSWIANLEHEFITYKDKIINANIFGKEFLSNRTKIDVLFRNPTHKVRVYLELKKLGVYVKWNIDAKNIIKENGGLNKKTKTNNNLNMMHSNSNIKKDSLRNKKYDSKNINNYSMNMKDNKSNNKFYLKKEINTIINQLSACESLDELKSCLKKSIVSVEMKGAIYRRKNIKAKNTDNFKNNYHVNSRNYYNGINGYQKSSNLYMQMIPSVYELPSKSTTNKNKYLSLSFIIHSQIKNGSKVLLLGENDFSFALSFIKRLQNLANNIILDKLDLKATSLETKKSAISIYGNKCEKNITLLESTPEVNLLYEVNARNISNTNALKDSIFDHIIINFPHLGANDDKLNKEFISDILESAYTHIHEKSKIWITLTEKDFNDWNVSDLGESKYDYTYSIEFDANEYPEYKRRSSHSKICAPIENCKNYVYMKR